MLTKPEINIISSTYIQARSIATEDHSTIVINQMQYNIILNNAKNRYVLKLLQQAPYTPIITPLQVNENTLVKSANKFDTFLTNCICEFSDCKIAKSHLFQFFRLFTLSYA